MIIPVMLLISLGVVVISTSSQALAIQQAIFALIGLASFVFIRNSDYRIIKSFIKPLYLILLILLIMLFIMDIKTRGSIRWIIIGPFNFQPSEFAKIVLILTLSNFWSNNLSKWINIAKSILIFLPFGLLIFFQPDLGTAFTLLFIWLSLLVASNISLIKLLFLFLLGLITTPSWWFLLRDYQKQRLLSFLYPSKDPLGAGYNVIQSTIAVGSGQLIGRGLGRGTQSRLQFLPEFRTDFIFAFIAEELGFIGSLIVLFLYTLIFFFCFKILFAAQDRFGVLIVTGVIAMLFFQIFVNIGMNTGIFPITGITLPLLSYGGSSIITTFISLGFVESVARFTKRQKPIDDFEFTSTI